MDRRTFIGGIARGLLVVPLAARAQQAGKVYRIGILEAIPAAQNAANLDALRKGLRDSGYVEGKNLLLDARSQGDLGRTFERAVRQHVDGLLIGADGLTQMHQKTIIELVARNRLPAAYPAREFVEAGGLIAYAVNYPGLYFRFATFVDKIFRGVAPSELPVEQPTKFELVINAKTAKSLGLTIPPPLLVRADEVIE